MNAHVINCKEDDFFSLFLPGGYLGVGIVINGINLRQLAKACRTSYSMYADMKTIRVGDMIFIHAGNKIYGVFKAVTEFCENQGTIEHFLSKNIHYYPNPNKPNSGWKTNITEIPDIGYYRRISITHFTDQDGRNLCFEKGFESVEAFELKDKKKVWSIPERWKYTDSARIVRPLMVDEAWEFIKILDRENSDYQNRRDVNANNLSRYIPIEFILNPYIVEDEKIIEGWILENVGRNSSLDSALGSFTCMGNNMPAGYLRFMDIFGYIELSSGVKKFKVIEVKKDNCIFPDDISQLIGYTDWIIENIASGDYKTVEGILFARDFDESCINFVQNFYTIGRKIRLIKFDYCSPGYNTLAINQVV